MEADRGETDLTAAFPATGARRAGFGVVPMLCAQEIPVPSAPKPS